MPETLCNQADWIPAAKVTPPSFKMELKMHSHNILFFATQHPPFAEEAVLHRIR